jgi:hypothetical protein
VAASAHGVAPIDERLPNMIALPHARRARLSPEQQEKFVGMLPTIRRVARRAFSDRDPEGQQEAIAEAIAASYAMFVALVARGRESLAYAVALAGYAVKRVSVGRMTATPSNCKDVSSRHCQLRSGLTLERLDRFDHREHAWEEVVVEDRRAGPAEIACARLDIQEWFRRLTPKDRKIARYLAAGNTTTDAARRFRVSAARISQKRRQFLEGWKSFQGADPATGGEALVPA